MGGYGSGRNGGHSARCKVEDSLVLDGYTILPKIFRTAKEGRIYSGVISWSRNGNTHSRIGYTMRGLEICLYYTKNKTDNAEYTVTLATSPQPQGGLRHWFRCPAQGCGRLAAKLYLPNGTLHFACRQCYNLTYESCNESRMFDSLFNRIGQMAGVSQAEAKRILKAWH